MIGEGEAAIPGPLVRASQTKKEKRRDEKSRRAASDTKAKSKRKKGRPHPQPAYHGADELTRRRAPPRRRTPHQPTQDARCCSNAISMRHAWGPHTYDLRIHLDTHTKSLDQVTHKGPEDSKRVAGGTTASRRRGAGTTNGRRTGHETTGIGGGGAHAQRQRVGLCFHLGFGRGIGSADDEGGVVAEEAGGGGHERGRDLACD